MRMAGGELKAPKTEGSERLIAHDAGTFTALRKHRRIQARERLAAGPHLDGYRPRLRRTRRHRPPPGRRHQTVSRPPPPRLAPPPRVARLSRLTSDACTSAACWIGAPLPRDTSRIAAGHPGRSADGRWSPCRRRAAPDCANSASPAAGPNRTWPTDWSGWRGCGSPARTSGATRTWSPSGRTAERASARFTTNCSPALRHHHCATRHRPRRRNGELWLSQRLR